jgi:hypothetical protein
MVEYDSLVDPLMRLSDEMKINYLHTACSKTLALANVRVTCESQSVISGRTHTMPYDQVVLLYRTAAAALDSTNLAL